MGKPSCSAKPPHLRVPSLREATHLPIYPPDRSKKGHLKGHKGSPGGGLCPCRGQTNVPKASPKGTWPLQVPGGVLAFPIFGPHLVASMSHGKLWPGDSPQGCGNPAWGWGVTWGCELLIYIPWGRECGGAKEAGGSSREALAEQDGSCESPWTVSWGHRHEGRLRLAARGAAGWGRCPLIKKSNHITCPQELSPWTCSSATEPWSLKLLSP